MSAVLNPSTVPAQAVEKALRTSELLRSLDTWVELESVLLRERFNKYQSREMRHGYLEFLFGTMNFVSVTTTVKECRDRKDDTFLALAVDGHADLILTGDKDLLVLRPFRGIAIMTPSEYLAR